MQLSWARSLSLSLSRGDEWKIIYLRDKKRQIRAKYTISFFHGRGGWIMNVWKLLHDSYSRYSQSVVDCAMDVKAISSSIISAFLCLPILWNPGHLCREHLSRGTWLYLETGEPYFIEFHAREQRTVRATSGKNEYPSKTYKIVAREGLGYSSGCEGTNEERGRERKSTTRSQLSLIVLLRAMFAVIIYAAYMLPPRSNPSAAIRPLLCSETSNNYRP